MPHITGCTAITVAEMLGVALRKYTDPTECARDLTADEALAICAEDPSLVYVDSSDVIAALTDNAIERLQREADASGNDLQRLICQRALTPGEWVLEDEMRTTDRVSAAQEQWIRNMLRADCRVECARAIAEALAGVVRS